MKILNKERARRLAMIAAGLLLLAAATALILQAFRSNMVFFFSPSQITAGDGPRDKAFRLGGMVERGSLRRAPNGLEASFILTDTANRVPVVYRGMLPDLFGEGQGAVAFGRMNGNGTFAAEEVLAKHDEKYMPPEVAASLKAAEAARKGGAR
ncbi:cytochrome c maturation protein CcmE [Noviherbaspirillum sedimenti]|uniref:Cytochrome c-type biogenesis protein CcmE n=1 Tax=Noviherbaspirillum sedimenti TaxID=2320865 RepID=A0A3A3GL92_9BURK|nr:cytochrome c maturation protein CcmE [Noviherbaspirillum sedimenti]RJG03036.1 cytochrome c maturation protein CcmE [Noviherbaspirillum sedimenti]